MTDEYYESKHEIAVSLVGVTNDWDAYAEVMAWTYPDGSFKNKLSADELREVATMLNDMADDLEGLNE